MSTNHASRVIAAYVARVDELQKQQQDALSTSELKSIARELGLGEADLAHADRTAQDHLQRGRGYLQHGLVEDAITELRSAVVLRPLDAAIVLALAEGFAARWQARRDTDARDEADQLARQALQLDPSLEDAYRLRRTLSASSGAASASTVAHPPGTSTSGLRWGLGLVGVGSLMFPALLVVLGVSLVLGTSLVGVSSSPVEIAVAPPPPVSVEAGGVTARSVSLASLPMLSLESRSLKLSEYDDSWSFEATGVMANTSDRVLKSVGARVDLLDASGRVVASQTFEVHEDYRARLLPGDTVGYGVLMYNDRYAEGYARPVEAVFSIIAAEADAAAASYPAPTPVSLTWQAEPPPGLVVEGALRQRSYTDSLNNKRHFRGVYEVHLPEGSAPAELLKLRVEFLDAGGNVVATDDSYAVSSQEPPLQGGDRRVVQFLTFLEAQPAGERLTVLEAR